MGRRIYVEERDIHIVKPYLADEVGGQGKENLTSLQGGGLFASALQDPRVRVV